ncbi:hypothetical protein GCM10023204_14060 [Actinomycetospora succinea]
MQAVPIVISIVAVVVSAFSAWNSVRQTRLTQRTRFGQLIEEISKVDREFDRLMDENEEIISEFDEINYRNRKEVLSRQALRLRLNHRQSCSREMTILAECLDYVQDHPQADRMHRRSIKAAKREGPVAVSSARSAYGVFLFAAGKRAEGSTELQSAVDVLPEATSDQLRRLRVRTLALRARQHFDHRHELDVADSVLNEVATLGSAYVLDSYAREFNADMADYRDQARTARRSPDPPSPKPSRRRIPPATIAQRRPRP